MRIVRVVMVVVLVGAALGAVTARGASTAPAPVSACTTGRLKVFLGGGSGGAAGSVYLGLHFVNKGATSCTLSGFPGISFVDARHHQVGAAARRTTPPSPRTITLKPGAQGSVLLRITQTLNYPAATCRARLARGLRVYPPGQRRSTFVVARQPVCSSTRTPQLSVTALVAGPPQG